MGSQGWVWYWEGNSENHSTQPPNRSRVIRTKRRRKQNTTDSLLSGIMKWQIGMCLLVLSLLLLHKPGAYAGHSNNECNGHCSGGTCNKEEDQNVGCNPGGKRDAEFGDYLLNGVRDLIDSIEKEW